MDEAITGDWLLIANLALLVVLLGLAVVVASLGRRVGALQERTAALRLARQTPAVRIGQRLPPLVATNLDGDDVDLDVLASGGRHIALLFVASECPICRTVAPAFRQRVANAGPGLAGFLVGSDTRQALREHAAAAGFDPAHCLLGSLLAVQLQVRVLPFLVLMDSSGRLLARQLIQGERALDRTLSDLPAVRAA